MDDSRIDMMLSKLPAKRPVAFNYAEFREFALKLADAYRKAVGDIGQTAGKGVIE